MSIENGAIRPKRFNDSRRVVLIMPGETVESLKTLQGYFEDILKAPKMSMASVIRAAVHFYKEYLDENFVRTLTQPALDDMVPFETFRAQQVKEILALNQIKEKPERRV